jgi:hypothetical protein
MLFGFFSRTAESREDRETRARRRPRWRAARLLFFRRPQFEALEVRRVLSGGTFTLGTTSLVESSNAGSDTDLLAASNPSAAWTASANNSWLHVSAGSASGAGNATVLFSFDANPNATARAGTLTIAGDTLSVTQAGTSYVAAGSLTTLVPFGLYMPGGIATDSSGNVYVVGDSYGPNAAIDEWVAATGTVSRLVVLDADSTPTGLAVDASGNLYFGDVGGRVREWVAATNTLTTLVSSGLSYQVRGVAVDTSGNVYIADSNNNAIKEWVAATNTVTTLVSSGLVLLR